MTTPEGWPIFVCGLHRSGTSRLTDRLAAGRRSSRLRETGLPEDDGPFLQDVHAQDASAGECFAALRDSNRAAFPPQPAALRGIAIRRVIGYDIATA